MNMLKWGVSSEQEICDCDFRQTMQHLLVCPMMDTASSPQDLPMANGIAIGCARHWEGTIRRTYHSWWKDKNDCDDDRNHNLEKFRKKTDACSNDIMKWMTNQRVNEKILAKLKSRR